MSRYRIIDTEKLNKRPIHTVLGIYKDGVLLSEEETKRIFNRIWTQGSLSSPKATVSEINKDFNDYIKENL